MSISVLYFESLASMRETQWFMGSYISRGTPTLIMTATPTAYADRSITFEHRTFPSRHKCSLTNSSTYGDIGKNPTMIPPPTVLLTPPTTSHDINLTTLDRTLHGLSIPWGSSGA